MCPGYTEKVEFVYFFHFAGEETNLSQASETKLSFIEQTKRLSWPFWVVNIMEMIERLAYYGVRVVIPIYIAQADEPLGLHFTQEQKGLIFLIWAVVQSFLPVFTGGFADRYGYKKQIVAAVIIKAAGYTLMATMRDFTMFTLGCVLLAAGTAIFKPPIQGTMVKSLNKDNSGVGWGFFYQIVNIGGFLGPPFAHYMLGWGWDMVFYGCAVMVSLNLLWLLTYKGVESGADQTTDVWHVIATTAKSIWNYKLILFILIASAFWAAFMQLFDMLPNYIVDWVNSSSLAVHLPEFLLARNSNMGPQLAQEWIINFNPLLIIFFVPFISAFVNKYMRRLTSIMIGFTLASLGVLVAGWTMSIYIVFMGITMFSFGEMLCSPKMHEYLGVIAPDDKKALFMGYANIPVGIGWGFGALFGGQLYGNYGEKAALALKYLQDTAGVAAAQLPERNQAFEVLMQQTGMSATDATRMLFETYNPSVVWWPFAAMGIFSAVMLSVYNHYAKKWEDANA